MHECYNNAAYFKQTANGEIECMAAAVPQTYNIIVPDYYTQLGVTFYLYANKYMTTWECTTLKNGVIVYCSNIE